MLFPVFRVQAVNTFDRGVEAYRITVINKFVMQICARLCSITRLRRGGIHFAVLNHLFIFWFPLESF